MTDSEIELKKTIAKFSEIINQESFLNLLDDYYAMVTRWFENTKETMSEDKNFNPFELFLSMSKVYDSLSVLEKKRLYISNILDYETLKYK